MNSTFRARWLASLEVISHVLFTSEQPKKNKMAFVGILPQKKLLFGSLIIQLEWYILKQLFTSVSVKYLRGSANIPHYYSTNCNTIQIWSWCSRYLSSVGNVYPAIYVASYVGRKSEVKKCRQKDLKMLRVLLSICWIIKQLSCSISRNIVWF